jgi:hypothetical protein
VANYQKVLDSVTYSSTSANPTNFGADLSRTLRWQVYDGTHHSTTVTSTVTVVGVDQAPVLGGANNTVTYTQGDGAATASGALTVSDVDSTDLASASVKISTGFFAGDTLTTTTTGTSIIASYNATTGVLTLTGSDTLSNYRHVLHLVKFSSTSGNPTDYGTDLSRTLSWQVNDGTLNSNTVASTVKVVGVDQPPVLGGAGNTVTFTQGGAPVAASPAITASSVDNLDLASATVKISTGFFAGDTLAAVTTGTAITVSYNAGTHVLTLTGSDTVANYQKVLKSVTYSSASANPTNFGADLSRTLSWQVYDGTHHSTTVTSKVTVTALAPFFVAVAATVRPARRAVQSKSPKLANTRLSMGSLSAAPGASVTLPVSISNARGLQSMQLVIRYDARALTPVTVEPRALTTGFAYKVVVVQPGELRINANRKKPLRVGSGELFGLKFALAPTAAGTFRIDFLSASLNDARLMVSDPNEGAIIVKAKNPEPAVPHAGGKPSINLTQPARSFELGSSKTHAWLDDFLKPSEGKNGKANSWTVEVKRRTLH